MSAWGNREGDDGRVIRALSTITGECSDTVYRRIIRARYVERLQFADFDEVHGNADLCD